MEAEIKKKSLPCLLNVKDCAIKKLIVLSTAFWADMRFHVWFIWNVCSPLIKQKRISNTFDFSHGTWLKEEDTGDQFERMVINQTV